MILGPGVQLVEVDHIGSQSGQLLFQGRGYPGGLEGVFGRNNPTTPAVAQELPEDQLGIPIYHRGIDKIAPQFLRARQGTKGILAIDAAVRLASNCPRAKTHLGHLKAGSAKATIRHGSNSLHDFGRLCRQI
jgi:hypothetical protein